MPDNPPIEFEVPLTTLTTRVDTSHRQPFEDYLQAHGVQVQKTGEHTYDDQAGGEQGDARYRLCFPAGSKRLDGLTLVSTTPFKIICPDGEMMEGHEDGNAEVGFEIPDPWAQEKQLC